MARIVMKFGGTSMAGTERIRRVANIVRRQQAAGHEVAVVVSAMAGVTNQLVGWVGEISRLHDAREYDVVVASGEQVTAGLLALALQDLGVDARSWLGWQIPLGTDGVHGKARIGEIATAELERRFKDGQVAVVAGFQGLGPDNRITPLGRGGRAISAIVAAVVRAHVAVVIGVDEQLAVVGAALPFHAAVRDTPVRAAGRGARRPRHESEG